MTDEFHFSPRPNRAGEIHWRSWSEQAFAEAATADKPILLAISAVWCHWCHVMDETSYSDQTVIDLVNRDYVPIRVDNDLRPDINQRYNMGGWPTTAFLTPQGDILTGGTYLPPDQMAGALERIGDYYKTNRPEVESRVLEGRQKAAAAVAAGAGKLETAQVDIILDAADSAYDSRFGGFGNAPKFPQTDAILLLAEQALIRRQPALLEMATHTLKAMAGGGTYDHVEGGFFRYSTTQDWSVPHFEKMLEDHGGLLSGLAACGLGDILDDAARYLDTVLRDPQSGLYGGSQDADEHYYTQDASGRQGLEAPYIDRRIYASWNCSLAIAYLEADLRLDRPGLRASAAHLLEVLFKRLYSPAAGMARTDGVTGQLGDQVWALWAAVRAASAGIGPGWVDNARSLAGHLEEHYGDPELGGYFDHAGGDRLGRLEERLKPLAENAVAAIALHELDTLLAEPGLSHRTQAVRALDSVAALPSRYGLMAAVFARAADRLLRPQLKVTTTSRELAAAALAAYPYAVIERAGDERAVICLGTMCLAPVTSPELVAATIATHV